MTGAVRRLLPSLGLLVLLGGCSQGGAGTTSGLPSDAIDYSVPVVITYEVTGSAPSVDVVLEHGDDRTEANGRSVPLLSADTGAAITVEVPIGERVALSASVGPAGGDVQCRLLADGEPIDAAVAQGAYASAECTGRAPYPER